MSDTIQTPEAAAAPVASPEANIDRVAAVSYRADGTPDQTPGFVQLFPSSLDA